MDCFKDSIKLQSSSNSQPALSGPGLLLTDGKTKARGKHQDWQLPAKIRPRQAARCCCRTADPLRPALGGATGKVVQAQGARAAWLCWHPSPQHSSASPAPAQVSPRSQGALWPLPSKLQYHTTAQHCCPLRGALPAPCQTPHPQPAPQHRFGNQPELPRGGQPAHTGHGAPRCPPAQGGGVRQVLPGAGGTPGKGQRGRAGAR